ncbi:MAG: M20/M25/M40 family metallo-hydrolase, partial [Anaerolineales bacterium]|nr:M20/M25/M40 family metallo-hydrolase [Anaerolineales bacterium]
MQSNQMLEDYLTEGLPRYLAILQKMVMINSFTANAQGVNHLGQVTAELFAGLGFHAEFVPSQNQAFGSHLFLSRPGSVRGKLAMISHLDTVFSPEEEVANNFTWRVEGERAYGPGTVDIKGGTLMIFMVLESLKQCYPDIFDAISWLVAIDASEEVLSRDFGQALLSRLGSETLACLVYEGGTPLATKYPLVTARKGRAKYIVTVEGRSAHAGNHHDKGANAIIQMAHTVQQIAALTNYDQQLTFNVGTIHGGSVVNRVPHYAQAEVEMRTFSPQIFSQGAENILALNGRSQVSSQDGYECKVEIRQVESTSPWPRNPGTDRLFELFKEVG